MYGMGACFLAWLGVTLTLAAASYASYRLGPTAGYCVLGGAAWAAFALFERFTVE